MKNRKYYMVVTCDTIEEKVYLASPQTGYIEEYMKDITEYDLITTKYQKDDFLNYLQDTMGMPKSIDDIFLVRKEASGFLQTYECFFHTNTKNALLGMRYFAEERLKKVYQKDNILLEDSLEYQKFIYFILKSILSNQRMRMIIARNDSLLESPVIKRKLLECDTMYRFEHNRPLFSSHFRKYKNLRALVLEYLAFYNGTTFSRTFDRKEIAQKIIQDQKIRLSDEEYARVIFLEREPFQSKTLEYYYLIGGREAILANMDANEIFSCSLEDLLRAGIFSREQYIIEKREQSQKLKF